MIRLDGIVFALRLATAVVGLLREAVAFAKTLGRHHKEEDRSLMLAVLA